MSSDPSTIKRKRERVKGEWGEGEGMRERGRRKGKEIVRKKYRKENRIKYGPCNLNFKDNQKTNRSLYVR
jgi:hypothetical protein